MPDEDLATFPPIHARAADAPYGGRSADVTVELTNLTYRDTPEGRRFPYGEFGPDFIARLHSELPTLRFKGLIRRRPICAACETDLTDVPELPTSTSVEVALGRIPPIQVAVEMPGITCPSCGRRMVGVNDHDVASELSNALIAAFDAVGLRP